MFDVNGDCRSTLFSATGPSTAVLGRDKPLVIFAGSRTWCVAMFCAWVFVAEKCCAASRPPLRHFMRPLKRMVKVYQDLGVADFRFVYIAEAHASVCPPSSLHPCLPRDAHTPGIT